MTPRWIGAVGLVVAVVLAGCAREAPPGHGHDARTGFPYGVYGKDMDDAELGRIRLEWVFGPDGRWAEVPIALDGQPQLAPVVRGTYTVDGEEVTIATSWPAGWGTSTHRWRLDREDLWTAFVSSDVPGDAGWFATLDQQPWRPLP